MDLQLNIMQLLYLAFKAHSRIMCGLHTNRLPTPGLKQQLLLFLTCLSQWWQKAHRAVSAFNLLQFLAIKSSNFTAPWFHHEVPIQLVKLGEDVSFSQLHHIRQNSRVHQDLVYHISKGLTHRKTTKNQLICSLKSSDNGKNEFLKSAEPHKC